MNPFFRSIPVTVVCLLLPFVIASAQVDGDPVKSSVDSAEVERVKQALILMNEQMYLVASEIESTEDVEAADEKLEEIFGQLAAELHEALGNPELMMVVQQQTQSDPQMQEWERRIGEVHQQLAGSQPETFALYERLVATHQAAFQQHIVERRGNNQNEEGAVSSVDIEMMKQDLLGVNERLHDVVIAIETPEDVDEQSHAFDEIFDDLASCLVLAVQNPIQMQQVEADLGEEPKLQEWNQNIQDARARLESENPDALVALETELKEQNQKLQQIVAAAAGNMESPTE
jgi:hypothetical protein